MKTLISYIFILTAIVYLNTYEGAKPVYKNNYKSPLPERVTSEINSSIALNCKMKGIYYQVKSESISNNTQSFIYNVELANTPLNSGRVILEEKHSGEIIVKNLECPGKSGAWYSYSHPSRMIRQIAGVR